MNKCNDELRELVRKIGEEDAEDIKDSILEGEGDISHFINDDDSVVVHSLNRSNSALKKSERFRFVRIRHTTIWID